MDELKIKGSTFFSRRAFERWLTGCFQKKLQKEHTCLQEWLKAVSGAEAMVKAWKNEADKASVEFDGRLQAAAFGFFTGLLKSKKEKIGSLYEPELARQMAIRQGAEPITEYAVIFRHALHKGFRSGRSAADIVSSLTELPSTPPTEWEMALFHDFGEALQQSL